MSSRKARPPDNCNSRGPRAAPWVLAFHTTRRGKNDASFPPKPFLLTPLSPFPLRRPSVAPRLHPSPRHPNPAGSPGAPRSSPQCSWNSPPLGPANSERQGKGVPTRTDASSGGSGTAPPTAPGASALPAQKPRPSLLPSPGPASLLLRPLRAVCSPAPSHPPSESAGPAPTVQAVALCRHRVARRGTCQWAGLLAWEQLQFGCLGT